ncbi:MAG: exonuclease SbcCD subunit D C-terminal domain-containing protein, partial [Pseudomonas marincola]|uniref:exonuclease SbcCD subunit D C-terminal domain-containing protein n=2 Tax=Pseudomonas TaxID=286 RepID=UPI003001DED4
VDLDSSGLQQVSALAVPRTQVLLSLKGSLKELQALIADAAQQGTDQRPVWLEIQVSADDYLSDLQVRIAALCEGLPVEVLRIRRERGAATTNLFSDAKETLDELSPEQVFAQRLSTESLDKVDEVRLQELYREMLERLHNERG